MTPRRRWTVVVAGTVLLLVLPFLVGRLPAGSSQISAPSLLQRIEASAGVPYSGYAETDGGLSLPVTDSAFSELADLLGGQTNLRVWWRGAADWRVDAVSLTGETDLAQDAKGLWNWDYEANRAQRTDYTTAPAIRLPRADDLLPPTLARRLLSGARTSEVTRLPNARVAGEEAAGLRLRPSLPQSTVDHVDVWALPSSGLPVRVDVYGTNGRAAMRTTMLDLSTERPSSDATSFTPPPGAFVENEGRLDIANAIDQLAPVKPPKQLAGLSAAPDFAGRFGSVGVYGRGVTVLIAVPLPPRFGFFLEQQLAGEAAAESGDGRARTLAIGPISLRLTARADNGTRWLLAGTVTKATLAAAEPQLPLAQDFFR